MQLFDMYRTGSYPEVAEFCPFCLCSVNILHARVVMSVFQVHADLCYFLFPSSLLLSPFVFVISDIVSQSFTSHLKAALLSPSLAVCLMFRPRTGLLCFACDTFVFPVISGFFMPSLCCCCAEGGVSCRHLSFYLCYISWVISVLLCTISR